MVTSKDVGKLLKLFGPNGEGWTQHTYARDKNGVAVTPSQSEAVQFCVWGAAIKVGIEIHQLKLAMSEAGAVHLPYFMISQWNDSRQFPEVYSALNKTAIFLKEREAAK